MLDGTITQEELDRLRELERKYGLEEMQNPFEAQKLLNQEFDDNINQSMNDSMNHSKISDKDNFQELPPVQVLNNLQQSPDQKKLEEEELKR